MREAYKAIIKEQPDYNKWMSLIFSAKKECTDASYSVIKSQIEELSDEELDKVAGGKGWEADDLDSGMIFLLWQNETTWCYWHIVEASATIHLFEYRISKSDVTSYTYAEYASYSREFAVQHLNENGAKEKAFPAGFRPVRW